MFPQSFNARVGERMAIWGAVLGFLFLLYVATEIIQTRHLSQMASERQAVTATAMAHVIAESAAFASEADRIATGKRLLGAIESVNAREVGLTANHRQNKILLLLLGLFVAGQILILEYRWLIRPIVRIADVLRAGGPSPRL